MHTVVSHFLTYQAPECSTDSLTILTAVQVNLRGVTFLMCV